MKRGQVTIFVIIAILIIASGLIFFMVKNNIREKETSANIEPVYSIFFMVKNNIREKETSANIEPVYSILTSCLEDTSKSGVYFIASHGGYFNVPFNSSIVYFTEDIPYYYLEGKNLTPIIEDVQKELGDYISMNLENCIYSENYTNNEFKISTKEYSVLVGITHSNINIKLKNPITISKENYTAIFENVETNVENNLTNLYYASSEIVGAYSEKPGFVCLTCVDEISSKYNVTIESIPVNDISLFDNDIIWYSITNKEDYSYDKLKWIFIVEA